jgi:hypothetical protein
MTISDTHVVYNSVLDCIEEIAPYAERDDPDALEYFLQLVQVGQAIGRQLQRKLDPLHQTDRLACAFPIRCYRRHAA